MGGFGSARPDAWPGVPGSVAGASSFDELLGNNGGNPPPTDATGGPGGGHDPNYLVKAVFVEAAFEGTQPRGEIVVRLIRDPSQNEAEGNQPIAGRYSHGISKHSPGAPEKTGTYSQFESTGIMHAARDAFIEQYKGDILARQRDIESGKIVGKEAEYHNTVTLPHSVGWVAHEGALTKTNIAFFRFNYVDGTWREDTGFPRNY